MSARDKRLQNIVAAIDELQLDIQAVRECLCRLWEQKKDAERRAEALAALEALRQHGHRPNLQGDAGGWCLVVTGWDRETEKPFPMVVEGRDLTQMMQDAVEWCAPRRFPGRQADA